MSVKKWIEEVREHAEPEIVIMLVGNKLDLAEQHPSERKVAREFAADYARKNKLLFMETSAFADVNVRDVFEYLVQEIYTVQNSQNLNSMRNQTRGRMLQHSDPNLGQAQGGMCCGQ